MRPRNRSSSRMPRVLNDLKAITPSPSGGRGGGRIRRGGRPWHVRSGRPRHLGGPRLSSTPPGFAESRCVVSDARRVCRRTCRRPLGTAQAPASREATGKGHRSRGGGGQGVGGRPRSRDVGARGGARPRPSTGGPCGGALQGGPRPHAATWEDMSPGLLPGGERAPRAPAGRFHALGPRIDGPALQRA